MKKLITLLVIISFFSQVNGQGSMMDDVNQPFLDRLIELGKANYPKFKYTTAKSESAKAAYNKTKWGVLDFVTLGYVYYPSNAGVYDKNGAYNSYLNGYQVGVFLNAGSMLQKPSAIKGAKQDYVAAKMDKEVIDLDVVQEIRKRYYTYIQASSSLKLKTRAMADADDILKHAKYKFEKGEVSFENYNQGLIAYSTFSQEKINAEANMLIAKTSLEELIGTTLENVK